MKYKLVIFDFDGTLADTFPFALNIMDQVVEKFGLKKIDQSEIDLLRSMDARKVMKHLDVPLWKMPAITSHVMTLLGQQIHLLSLFEGIDQLLRELSAQGIKIGVVTSNTYENVCKILGPVVLHLLHSFYLFHFSYLYYSACIHHCDVAYG